jgi:hypothetical protein
MGKSNPAPIDYEAAALAEGEAAKEVANQQTWANRPTQVNPWGTTTWETKATTDPGTNTPVTAWKQEQRLAGPLNEALNSQMRLQQGRSSLAEGMMGGLKNSYFDENGNYRLPQFNDAMGGMMMPGTEGLPDRWGHLQWDIPQYTTTGQVRQLNYGALPGLSSVEEGMGNLYGVNDPQFTLDRAENATYDRMAARLQQQQQSEAQQLEIKLRNQGLVPGDEAYQAQMLSHNQKYNDAFQNAQNEAIMAGGREAQRMYGMEMGLRQQGQGEVESLYGMQSGRRGMFAGELQDLGQFANQAAMNDFQQRMAAGSQGFQDTLSAANFQNQARAAAQQENYQYADYHNQLRQAQMNEYLAQRGFTLNEIQALINNQQVGLPQFSQFTNATKADTAPILQGAIAQGQANAAQASADNAIWNSLIGGGMQAGALYASGGMFSDRRLKSDIQRIGTRNGVDWYSYTIFGKPQSAVGVIHASVRLPDG